MSLLPHIRCSQKSLICEAKESSKQYERRMLCPDSTCLENFLLRNAVVIVEILVHTPATLAQGLWLGITGGRILMKQKGSIFVSADESELARDKFSRAQGLAKDPYSVLTPFLTWMDNYRQIHLRAPAENRNS